MPWYGRADFYRLLEFAVDRHEMTADYNAWHAQASAVARDFLARGQALQIVTIQADNFLAWLEAQGLPNTAVNRLRYVEQRAAASAATVADMAMAANEAAARACHQREAASVDSRGLLDQHSKDGDASQL